jgi:hypothetical protein
MIRISGGGSSRRPRSIQDCRARGGGGGGRRRRRTSWTCRQIPVFQRNMLSLFSGLKMESVSSPKY